MNTRKLVDIKSDGVMDTDDKFYTNHRNLYDTIIKAENLQTGLRTILDYLVNQGVKDSATLVCWDYFNSKQGQYPSD